MATIKSEFEFVEEARSQLSDALIRRFGVREDDIMNDDGSVRSEGLWTVKSDGEGGWIKDELKRIHDWAALVIATNVHTDGKLIFRDDGSGADVGTEFNGYADTAISYNSIGAMPVSVAIDGVSYIGTNISHYGECNTAATEQVKEVTISGYKLLTGSKVYVKFTLNNTATDLQLNVSGTGAIPIYYRGAAIPARYLTQNKLYCFVFDGTNYELVGDVLDAVNLQPADAEPQKVGIPSVGSSYKYALEDHVHGIDVRLEESENAVLNLTAETNYTLTIANRTISFKTPIDTKYNYATGVTLPNDVIDNDKVPTSGIIRGVYGEKGIGWNKSRIYDGYVYYYNTNTWQANTSEQEGYVKSPNKAAYKVWSTKEAESNPDWISWDDLVVGRAKLLDWTGKNENQTFSPSTWNNGAGGSVVWGQQWYDTELAPDNPGKMAYFLTNNANATKAYLNTVIDGYSYAKGFRTLDKNNDYVLLAGGGTKELTDFLLAGSFVKTTGDTMTGDLVMNTKILFKSAADDTVTKYITSTGTNDIRFSVDDKQPLILSDTAVRPSNAEGTVISLGTASQPWKGTYTTVLNITSTTGGGHLNFNRAAANYITAPEGGSFAFVPNGNATDIAGATIRITDRHLLPGSDTSNRTKIGLEDNPFGNAYLTNVYADYIYGSNIYARFSADTSQVIYHGFKNTSGDTIAALGYHNTAQKLYLNPIYNEISNVYEDALGKYSLAIGKNHLTYNTYPILHSGNFSSYVTQEYVNNLNITAVDLKAYVMGAGSLLGKHMFPRVAFYYTSGGVGLTDIPTWTDQANGFGMMTMPSADAYYMQLLSSSNNTLSWRRKQLSDQTEGGWKLLLDSETFKTYVTKAYIDGLNVNADTLDGVHASGLFTNLSNDSNQLSITIGGTNKKLEVAYAKSADTANFTHNKKIYANLKHTKSDHKGWPVYVCIADVTEIWNASSGATHKGFVGIVMHERHNGYSIGNTAFLNCKIGYNKDNYSLNCTASEIVPCVIQNGSKYYLALTLKGSGHDYYFYGYALDLLNPWIEVLTTDSTGTLPSGYSVVKTGGPTSLWAQVSKAMSADKLTTARKLWGLTFDGTADVKGDIKEVAHIYASGNQYLSSTSPYIFFRSGLVGPYIVGGETTFDISWHKTDNSFNKNIAKFTSDGKVGIGMTPEYTLDVNGSTRTTTLKIGNNNTSNYITFYGTYGDNPGGFNHTYIGERIWSTPQESTEASELVFIKCNDPGAARNYGTTVSGSGPDRIRHIAGAHVFQIYNSAISGTFENVSNNTNLVTKFDISPNRTTSYNDIYILHATNATMDNTTTNPKIVFSENGGQSVGLVYCDYDTYRASKGLKVMDVDGDDARNVWFEVQGEGYIKNGAPILYQTAGTGTRIAGFRNEAGGNLAYYWGFNGGSNQTYAVPIASMRVGYATNADWASCLHTKGTNTITNTTNDTTAKWGEHYTSIHWYTATGLLINQPSQYGYILNVGSDSEVHQLWMTQSSGNMYHRGGNASGWNGTWRRIIDSVNISPTLNWTNASSASAGSTLSVTVGGVASNTITISNVRSSYVANWLNTNSTLTYGASGLNYFNINGTAGTTANANVTPEDGWYHILRMNHANNNGYFFDIAAPLNNVNGIYYRQVRSGANYGWYKLLDSNNYTSYTVTKTGVGASGTWGINISGTADLAKGLLGNGYTSGNSNIIKPFWNTKSDGRWYLLSADAAYQCRVSYSDNSDMLDGLHLSNIIKWGYAYPGGNTSKVWHNVATFSYDVSSSQINTGIGLYVSQFYGGQARGILLIDARAETGGSTLSWLRIGWVTATGIDPNNFVGTYKKSGNIITIKLWCYCSGLNAYTFTKITEGAWTSNYNNWTLNDAYNGNSYTATALPSGETQVVSSLLPLNISNASLPYRLQERQTSNSSQVANPVSGFHYISSGQGEPFKSFHTSNVDFGMISYGYSDSWGMQIGLDFRTNHLAVRNKNNGTWNSWRLMHGLNEKISRAGGSYNWYSIQQYNSSDANPAYYSSDCAIINLTSYSGWQPWIRAVDSEKGVWTIGNYTNEFHIGRIPKTNTANSLTYHWTFGSTGYTTFPDGMTVPGRVRFTGLDAGTSDVSANTEILTSYASDNGFADTNGGPGIVYRRPASKIYNYIKNSASGTWGINISGYADWASCLHTKGTNTITNTTNDTTAKWGEHYTSIHWYTATGLLINQPSQYGYILNVGSDSEVHQLWMTQSSGNMYHRGGNASGWNGTWRTILDSSNWSTYCAAASHTHSYLPLSGGTMTGTITMGSNAINGGDNNTILVYKPAANTVTGVSNSQWCVGPTTCQGVIRSSNTDLIHYRTGASTTNTVILDSANYTSYVSKIGTATVGDEVTPVYLSSGTLTACNSMEDISYTSLTGVDKLDARYSTMLVSATANGTLAFGTNSTTKGSKIGKNFTIIIQATGGKRTITIPANITLNDSSRTVINLTGISTIALAQNARVEINMLFVGPIYLRWY